MTRSAAIVALILSAAALTACGEKPEPEITGVNADARFEITGGWKGELRRRQAKPVSIQVRIESLERSKQNVVRYGGELGCSGTWEYLGVSATAYRFREVIDSARGGECKGTGTVTLTPLTRDTVAYELRGSAIHRQGRLTRTGPD